MTDDLTRDEWNAAARLAYEAFNVDYDCESWDDMPDHRRFRWRLAARALVGWERPEVLEDRRPRMARTVRLAEPQLAARLERVG